MQRFLIFSLISFFSAMGCLTVNAGEIVLPFSGELPIDDDSLSREIGTSISYSGEIILDDRSEPYYTERLENSDSAQYHIKQLTFSIAGNTFEFNNPSPPEVGFNISDGWGGHWDYLAAHLGGESVGIVLPIEIEGLSLNVMGLYIASSGPGSVFSGSGIEEAREWANTGFYNHTTQFILEKNGEYFFPMDWTSQFIDPAESINYGLFMGAYDSGFWDVTQFDEDAFDMATAFAARPNTKAYVLLGDLSLDSDGNMKNPIEYHEIWHKLQVIRSQMRTGDTLTLYISNHGGSVYKPSLWEEPITNDDGDGDEYIVMGQRLEDHELTYMLEEHFGGFRKTVFLDTCHGGGFWGGTDPLEKPPYGWSFDDLNSLDNIALYSAAGEKYAAWGWGEKSFWGEALLKAFKRPEPFTAEELGDFLEEETLNAFGVNEPVWFSKAHGENAPADLSLIQTFSAHSDDFDINQTLLAGPAPISQFESLIDAVTGIGPGTSLFDKMTEAKTSYENDDVVAACGTLEAFVHQVNANTGKKIPTGDAAQFVASAEFTMASIGCN